MVCTSDTHAMQAYTELAGDPLLGSGLPAPEQHQTPAPAATSAAGCNLPRRLPATLSTPARLRAGHGPFHVWRAVTASLHGHALVVEQQQNSPAIEFEVGSVRELRRRTSRRGASYPQANPPPLLVAAAGGARDSAAAACRASASSALVAATTGGGGGGRTDSGGSSDLYVVLEFSPEKQPIWRDALCAAARFTPSMADYHVIRAIGKGGGGQVFLVRQRVSRQDNNCSTLSLPAVTSWSSPKSANRHASDTGTTEEIMRTTSPYLAMKVIQKFSAFHSETSLQHTLDERLVLQLASSHPFIVSLHSAFQSDKAFYLLTEFCSGGDLRGRLSRSPNGRLPEQMAVSIFAQIVLALEHLHSLNVVYRDMKPENVLIAANGDVRLCDFGLSKVLNTGRWGRTKSFCGTTGYMSPEIVRRRSPYGIASDLWSLGVLLYRSVVGRGPFDAPHKHNTAFAPSLDDSETFRRIMHEDVSYPSFLSNAVVELLTGLLEKEEEKRFNLEEVKESLFFSSVNWDQVLEQGRKSQNPCTTVDSSPVSSVCSDMSFESAKSLANLQNFDLERVEDVVMDRSELVESKVTDGSDTSVPKLRNRDKRLIRLVPGINRLVPRHASSTTVVGYAFSSQLAARSVAQPVRSKQ